MTKVSVIIPIFNMERYLPSCLDSVLAQSLKEIEVICVNDGSEDRTSEILALYCQRDNRIRVISQENQGVGIARNNGLGAARGEYVAFLDPDDYYPDANVLNDMYQNAINNQVLICGGSLWEDHDNGKWFRKRFVGTYKNYTFKRNEYISYEDYQYDYGFYRFIYHRKFLIRNNIFFPPYIRFQDPPFFVNAMIQAKGFYALKRVTYCYRIGHQRIIWSEKKACALLNGLIDNLRMSAEAGLPKLHCLTLDRMLSDYKEPFVSYLESQSEEITELLRLAEQYLVPEYIAQDIDCKVGLYPIWQEYRKRAYRSKFCKKKLPELTRDKKYTVFAKILRRIKLYFRLSRKWLYRRLNR